MRSSPLSTAFFALFFAVPVLACAGAESVGALGAPTPAPVVGEATPAPLPPVLIGPNDFVPTVPGTASVAASEQPGSEPMAKKKAKSKEKDKAAPKAAKPKGPQTGITGAAANYDSFVAARDAVAMDSEKSAALFVQALIAYTIDQEIGHEMISTMLKPKDMKVDSDARSGYHLGMGTRDDLLQLLKKQYIMPGY